MLARSLWNILRITIATGRKGTTFDYFGEKYRVRFARAGIELNVRETAGALENLRLLRDSNANVQGRIFDRWYFQQQSRAQPAVDGTHLQRSVLGFLFSWPTA